VFLLFLCAFLFLDAKNAVLFGRYPKGSGFTFQLSKEHSISTAIPNASSRPAEKHVKIKILKSRPQVVKLQFALQTSLSLSIVQINYLLKKMHRARAKKERRLSD